VAETLRQGGDAPPPPPAGPPEPERDDAGKLTRRGMEQVIEAGGSVHLQDETNPRNFVMVHEARHLPSEAQLAKGNPAAEERARRQLMDEIEERQRALAMLVSSRAPAEKPPEEKPPEEKPPGELKADGDEGIAREAGDPRKDEDDRNRRSKGK
jgi:hypothetical protein